MPIQECFTCGQVVGCFPILGKNPDGSDSIRPLCLICIQGILSVLPENIPQQATVTLFVMGQSNPNLFELN